MHLESLNTHDPERMVRALTESLKKWEQLPPEERLQPEDPESRAPAVRRHEDLYPEGGLVLRVHTRDLPRDPPVEARGWHARASNQDFAWFRKEEARQFLTERPRLGQQHEVAAPVVERITRFHLVDSVRGQTYPFPADAVRQARLTTEVTAVEGPLVSLRLEGETRTEQDGVWRVGRGEPRPQRRGYEARLLGRAQFDLEAGRFVVFELVAVGMRWGGTPHNGRGNDLDPAPMGVLLTLAGDTPADRVAPAAFLYGSYPWGENYRDTPVERYGRSAPARR